jgi:hypothetical protein
LLIPREVPVALPPAKAYHSARYSLGEWAMRPKINAALVMLLASAMPASAQTAQPTTLVFENRSNAAIYYNLWSTQRGHLIADTLLGPGQTARVSVTNPVPASPTRSTITVGHGNTGWCYFDVFWTDSMAGIMQCDPAPGYQPACGAFQGCTGTSATSHTFIRNP